LTNVSVAEKLKDPAQVPHHLLHRLHQKKRNATKKEKEDTESTTIAISLNKKDKVVNGKDKKI
jgi:hypothetical protein